MSHAKYLRSLENESGKLPEGIELQKQNVIVVGPTGVGKTYLVKHIAELIGVPFVKADATKFSETGYVGGDVDDLVRDLVQKADGDLDLAEFALRRITLQSGILRRMLQADERRARQEDDVECALNSLVECFHSCGTTVLTSLSVLRYSFHAFLWLLPSSVVDLPVMLGYDRCCPLL